jgi:hypothetical protein
VSHGRREPTARRRGDAPQSQSGQDGQVLIVRATKKLLRLGATANRSVVGVMTEFARLAEVHHDAEPAMDLVGLAVRLAETPCGPLYGRNVSPDRELAAALRAIAT